MCAMRKKFYERAVLSKRTRSFYIDSRPSFVTHATLATTRTTHVAFRTNLYLQYLLGVASRTQYNAHMRIYANANAIAVHVPHRHRADIALAACEKPTEHTIFQRENASCIPPRVDNA